ncbi:hypothetical protein [Alloalcanivorax mobilis]|uniref:hypothetical protein n=1 Tax=Alloalcanivorax mobilis TaxID=2019569 RepID=UPI000B5B3909|nr:hypothetical protein [Alloalcanivorax mobilis]ASK34017.1 hypothetical protein CEK62_06270 [Alcanivorax sp. N3-2A]|tara:strand:- start:27600 stop:28223 length:624 start_codon:yes stop_codon:yes gene_type:complete
MSDSQRQRRAIATGLTPYLDSAALTEALALWQRDYAGRARFSLQGYVSELCRLFEIAERRHDLHLSLVQAMSLPERALLADPVAAADSERPHHDAHPCTLAFQYLMRGLWEQLGEQEASPMRLDQLTDLRRQRFDADVRATMERWLNQPRDTLAPLPREPLQRLLNRAYVLLCERYGPVPADRLLNNAGERVRRHWPALDEALRALL